MLCMYMAYPLGLILNMVVRGTLNRHLFSTLTGFLLQLYMFRGQIVHPILMTVVSYLMMIFLSRTKVQHLAVFAFVMLYLSCSHIYRMWTNYGGWDMDITTYTMILTAKLSALAYCYRDGAYKDEDLLPEQVSRKVTKLPTPLEMASYVFFCSGCIVGPFFEFADYKMYIERQGRYASIPNSIVPALTKFLTGKRKHVINDNSFK